MKSSRKLKEMTMNKLDELFAKLCPDGVEWTTIENVCVKISSGGTPKISNPGYYGGNIPWLRTQEVDFQNIFTTSIKITESGLANSSANWIPENCVIVAMYGATAAKVAINKIPLTTNQACCNLHINEQKASYQFVFYWLSSQYEILKSKGQGSQSNINQKTIRKFPLPIPPLPIQKEIVRILDTFTALEAKLETKLEVELDTRKKQYEHYRTVLINENFSNITKSLGNIASYSNTRINAGSVDKSSFVGVDNLLSDKKGKNDSQYVPDSGTLTAFSKSDILIGNIRPYLKKIWFASNSGGASGDVLVIRLYENSMNIILPKYLFHVLASEEFFFYNVKYSRGAKMPRGNKEKIMQFPIPLPPLSEQQRIVSILDKFDALVNDISIGLPAEIEARRKQYEYYRDKLLTFKRKEH